MIRERRSKEKLQQYYRRFVEKGVLDPNVHPWVAESWQNSQARGIPRDSLRPPVKLTKEVLGQRQEHHRPILTFADGLYHSVQGYFNAYGLSMLLLDSEGYALKSFALPFFQKSPGEVEGARLLEEDIGASSIAIAFKHKTPFLMFGPEMWIEDGQSGDACSAPIFFQDSLEYVLTLVSTQQGELSSGVMETLLLTMKFAIENTLNMQSRLHAKNLMLDAMPLAAYQVMPGGRVTYANKTGYTRLAESAGKSGELPNLSEIILNYNHTPLAKGFFGIPAHNKEVTWITERKTYEDITTVVPMHHDGRVASIVAVSMTVEDLKMLQAYAMAYTARYSLASMVGQSTSFTTMKDKATRLARGSHHMLLQGESGTGKQRLAHGIHQASPRAAGPLITVKCGRLSPEMLEADLFGAVDDQGEYMPGKIELAKGGTLFIDEIENLPKDLAERLARVIAEKSMVATQSIRVIAACDSDIKRMMEKGKFSPALYELISRPTIKVPPLRARREDIPLLAKHIIVELAEQHALPTKELSAGASALLKNYEWPGNIKQLQGVIEQAFFQTTDVVIDDEHIMLPGKGGTNDTWKDDRDAFVAEWRAARGNISRLSGMLGVSRVTLYRYLRKYGLDKE
jgi:transcriptional regulator of acetoin/glycerol metabolism